jgi:hypothetical protein
LNAPHWESRRSHYPPGEERGVEIGIAKSWREKGKTIKSSTVRSNEAMKINITYLREKG